jgi:hypothetical protein
MQKYRMVKLNGLIYDKNQIDFCQAFEKNRDK